MAGLAKPRSRPVASRKAAFSVSWGGRNDSPFVSSYHDDKVRKYRQQRMEMAKKLFGGVALIIFVAAVKLRSGSVEQKVEIGTKSISKSEIIDGVEFLPDGSIHIHEPEKVPLTEPGVEFLPDGSVRLAPNWDRRVCGRDLPFSLMDVSQWPTKETVLVKKPRHAKEVILLTKDKQPRDLGSRLNAFFHAYDLSNDTGHPIYITQNSWVFDALFPLFFGPASGVVHDAKFWETVGNVLGAKVVENEGVPKQMGMKVHEYESPEQLLDLSSPFLDAATIRDHRNTILRKMFRYPSNRFPNNVCRAFDTLHGGDETKKYSVVHVAPPQWRDRLTELNRNTGRDNGAAGTMDPGYVRAVLKQSDMLEHGVYLIDGGDRVDKDAHAVLAAADRSGGLNITDLPQRFQNIGSYVYLAVLADVYLGNPVDPTSLWIARMRYALGRKNTFIFTEKRGDRWVSYLDDDSYLDLYDFKKLGITWMG